MFTCCMTYSLTNDEKKFLFNKHHNTSYKDIEKFQRELKKMINNNKDKELEDEKNLDKEFKLKFRSLK